jgi:ubiquinone/menaquinone biosynthesis C-methylase UbiE
MNKKTDVCPVEWAGRLDNRLRRFVQNPAKLLSPYIKEGMTVLDLGCGPGFFTIEIARMLIPSGQVIAADLQEGMLDMVKAKVKGTTLEAKIKLHKCQENSIGLTEKVDFVLAFFMVHEVPDHNRLFSELKSILNPKGSILIIEPNFHVSKEDFGKMIETIERNGLKIKARPKHFLCKALEVELR